MENYFVQSRDYRYSTFPHEGFSGNMYIALPQKDNLPRLLIKHAEPHSACNEFVYSRLGALLDVPVQRAYLMQIDKKDSWRFRSPYVVGLAYIDGLHPLDMRLVRSSAENMDSYIDLFALYAMFTCFEDIPQMGLTPSGRVIGYDFTEAFRMTSFSIRQFSISPDAGFQWLKRQLDGFSYAGLENTIRICIEHVAKSLQTNNTSDAKNQFHKCLRRMQAVTEQEIAPIMDALSEIYPLEVVVYYEEYVSRLQEMIGRILGHRRKP